MGKIVTVRSRWCQQAPPARRTEARAKFLIATSQHELSERRQDVASSFSSRIPGQSRREIRKNESKLCNTHEVLLSYERCIGQFLASKPCSAAN